jgi:hypothetical protein
MAQAPPGWYPDPSGSPGQRYFDGTTWTQWTYAADQGSTPQVRSDQQRGIDALRRARAGDVAGAISDLEGLLADQIRILGRDHPNTLDTRKALARLRRFSPSGVAQAIRDYEDLLADQIRILGRDHPDILATRKDLADCRYFSGDSADAVREYEYLLAEQVRILGPDDPLTLATREHLANSRRIAGDTAGAIRDHEDLLADRLRLGVVSIKSTSPGGRYIVCIDPFEAGPYQWVDTPELFDTAAGRALLSLTDRYWHLDSANWRS